MGDQDRLWRAYDFTLWYFRQGGDLSNAAVVSFYEHLFESFDVHEDVARWLHPQVVEACWSLLERRLDEHQLRSVQPLLATNR